MRPNVSQIAKRYLLALAAATLMAATVTLAAAPAVAQASANMCPSSPAAEGFFQQALGSLMGRFSGLGDTRRMTPSGMFVSRLNRAQRREVADDLEQELRGNLSERWERFSERRRDTETEAKLERLRNAIFARDRVERDARVTRLREYN